MLIVVGAEALRSAHRATRTIPIVANDLETDPVRSGFSASISRSWSSTAEPRRSSDLSFLQRCSPPLMRSSNR